MKTIDKKICEFYRILNEMDADKYFKHKFQNFCIDMFLTDVNPEDEMETEDNDAAFLIDNDFIEIMNQVENKKIIHEGEHKDLFLKSFTFAVLMFYSYVDLCAKYSYLSKSNMKRFIDKFENDFFTEDFPKVICDYYFYIKRKENTDMEKQFIALTEKRFPFFKELSKFTCDFIPSQSMNNPEDIALISESIKNSYICYINTLCLGFSVLLNYFNGVSLLEETQTLDPKYENV